MGEFVIFEAGIYSKLLNVSPRPNNFRPKNNSHKFYYKFDRDLRSYL